VVKERAARLAAALGPAPHLSAIRQVLQEAAAAGFEPKLLYQQTVLARPSDWPSAPPYEQVMEPDDLVTKLTPHRSAITRDQASRIAAEHLRRASDLVGAKVRKVVAWEEMTWRRPSIFNAPPGIESSWAAYLRFPNEPLMSCSSKIVIVSRTTGAVLYAGDANDEG
jgi:hypothetical protein